MARFGKRRRAASRHFQRTCVPVPRPGMPCCDARFLFEFVERNKHCTALVLALDARQSARRTTRRTLGEGSAVLPSQKSRPLPCRNASTASRIGGTANDAKREANPFAVSNSRLTSLAGSNSMKA